MLVRDFYDIAPCLAQIQAGRQGFGQHDGLPRAFRAILGLGCYRNRKPRYQQRPTCRCAAPCRHFWAAWTSACTGVAGCEWHVASTDTCVTSLPSHAVPCPSILQPAHLASNFNRISRYGGSRTGWLQHSNQPMHSNLARCMRAASCSCHRHMWYTILQAQHICGPVTSGCALPSPRLLALDPQHSAGHRSPPCALPPIVCSCFTSVMKTS